MDNQWVFEVVGDTLKAIDDAIDDEWRRFFGERAPNHARIAELNITPGETIINRNADGTVARLHTEYTAQVIVRW